MAAISIPAFFGMVPQLGVRLLEAINGAEVTDARSISGYLAGRERDEKLTTVVGLPRRVRRIERDGDFAYLTFVTPNVDIIRAPLVNDQFDRLFWAGEGFPPSFNTTDRIFSGLPGYFLGIDGPTIALSLTNTGGGDNSIAAETRFYVYTFVDSFGQESQPSPPSQISPVFPGDDITVVWALPPAAANKPVISTVRIYRTVPGANNRAAFFFVAERPTAPALFVDDLASSAVALNETMPSGNWNPPPTDMKGMAVLPNGFLVGFRGRDVLFSEPYQPYAWPSVYTLSVEDEIVGLGVFDTNVAILTTGSPYIASGVTPEAMSLIKVGPTNACVSRRSIVNMPGAVVYASDDGLASISVAGNSLLTQGVIDRDTWRKNYSPSTIIAARDSEARYVAFITRDKGFEIDFRDPARGFVWLTGPPGGVDGVDEDAEGRRALLMSVSDIYTFSTALAPAETYVWRSKEFVVPQPLNFAIAEIKSGAHQGANPPLPMTTLQFRMWADGVLRFDETVPVNKPFRLPSGFLADVFQFEFEGVVPVTRMMVAETGRELAGG
jgi:hypothetical protein